MSEKTRTPRTVAKPQARRSVVAFAVGLGVAGGLLGSGVLFAIAVGLGLLPAGRRWLWATPLLLCILAGCTTLTTRPPLTQVEPRPLGIVAHLTEGSAAALPAAVAAALDPKSDLAFRYQERAHQDDNEVPGALVLIVSPIFLLGVPTGSYTVTVSAELTVSRGSHEVARYQAAAVASRLYGFYYGSTLRELEAQARTQVRRAIDETLYLNADKLAAMTPTP
jgi:hypothetical protein